MSVAVVQQQRLWRACWQQPGSPWLLLWVGWMLLSALWSSAAWPHRLTHAWMYCLPLSAVVIGAACPPALAGRALAHFALVSGAVGGLWFVYLRGGLPESLLWQSTLSATGNQRIVASVLLALGAALACWLVPRQTSRTRKALLTVAAVLATVGLASQDRRSGMLLLPLLFLVWALALPRPWVWRAALVMGVAIASATVWMGSETVRGRFAEGSQELGAYSSAAPVATSWGIRLRMLELTADMVRQRPVFGHGLGSWQQQWDQRVPWGTRLADNSTPHNDYLMVAAQAGVPAAVLLMVWLAVMAGSAARAGATGVPALLTWFTLAATALANATLRDAKFALPLLLVAGLAVALAKHDKR